VERRCRCIYPAHANKIVRHKKLQKIVSKQRGPRANRAARTIDHFTNGREGAAALSMTSLVDATAEGEQNNLKQNSSMNHQMGLKLTLVISKQEFL
jgi:hypothetical protein